MRFFPSEKGETAFSKKNPRQKPFSLSRVGKIASRRAENRGSLIGVPLALRVLFPLQPPPPPPPESRQTPRLSHLRGLDFGQFRLRLAPFQVGLAPFGSVSGPCRAVGRGRSGVGERGFCKGKNITTRLSRRHPRLGGYLERGIKALSYGRETNWEAI